MNVIAIKSMEQYMMGLSIDTRKEKVREFLRFMDNPNFFDYDEENEIVETKDMWACYAYTIMLEKTMGNEISEREEKFLQMYFDRYILNTTTIGLEKPLKSFYLKYRLTKHFEDSLCNKEQTLEEFRLTIESLINTLYDEKFSFVLTKEDILSLKKDYVIFLSKNDEIVMMEDYLKEIYNAYVSNGYNPIYAFVAVEDIINLIETHKLNEVKKHGINNKAIVYTVEDYLSSKANKKNKLGKLYNELYKDIICHKQIFIDASLNTYEKLEELEKKMEESNYPRVDLSFKEYLKEKREVLAKMKHYYEDARYFDTTNLEEDAFAKLFNMYLNGLKGMPKSNLSDVTKYFALNGRPLTIMEMDEIMLKLSNKANKEKSEEKKAILLAKANEVSSIIELVKSQSYSYTLEEKIINYINNKIKLDDELLNDAKDHYSDFLTLESRLKSAHLHVQQLPSSGSASKAARIVAENDKLYAMLKMCEVIKYELDSKAAIKVDYDRDIVIKKTTNRHKAMTMVQELSGKNLLDCDNHLLQSMYYGEALFADLNPGFKEFITKALELNGVSEFRKSR